MKQPEIWAYKTLAHECSDSVCCPLECLFGCLYQTPPLAPLALDNERVRLDRDREASHDLNRLLDEPGGVSANTMQIYFQAQPQTECQSPRFFQNSPV